MTKLVTKPAFPKKTKKLTHKQLKEKAWRLFSTYIRLRDCDKYQKGGMVAPCYTCGTVTHFNRLQAGHFLSGRGNAVLFEEDQVHSQCLRCNIFLRGNPEEYWPRMLRDYGLEKINHMRDIKNSSKKLTDQDLLNIIEKYKQNA